MRQADCYPGLLVRCPSGRLARVRRVAGMGVEDGRVLLRYVGSLDDDVALQPKHLTPAEDECA